MNLESFTGEGSTPSRRRFWDQVTDAVLASQKVAGRNVSVDEHPGKGTVINVPQRTPVEAIGDICCDGNVCKIIPFSPDCQDVCGVFVENTPCSYCENNWCPPSDTEEVVMEVDGVTECGLCIDAGGGVFYKYTFDVNGTYYLSPSPPCVWETVVNDAVTQSLYSNPDCSGDPFATQTYDLRFRFSCTSLLPETGVHIFGRIYEESLDLFDIFSASQDFIDVNPWALDNEESCAGSSIIGTLGTVTFSW